MASGSSLENFLEEIDLQRYRARFESQGYDTVLDLCLLEEEDLDLLSIRDPNDRTKILEAGKYIFLSEICRMSVSVINICGTLPFLYGDRSTIWTNDLHQRYNLI